jgi:hypothetical protein
MLVLRTASKLIFSYYLAKFNLNASVVGQDSFKAYHVTLPQRQPLYSYCRSWVQPQSWRFHFILPKTASMLLMLVLRTTSKLIFSYYLAKFNLDAPIVGHEDSPKAYHVTMPQRQPLCSYCWSWVQPQSWHFYFILQKTASLLLLYVLRTASEITLSSYLAKDSLDAPTVGLEDSPKVLKRILALCFTHHSQLQPTL